MPRHQDSKVRTHPSVASFAAFFPCSTKFVYCKRRLNTAETWQQGYESVSFVAWYSFLHCRTMLEAVMRYTHAVYFASRMSPCTGIVEPFKDLLRVTAHPQLLALELWVPMGACSGQYGTSFILIGANLSEPHTSVTAFAEVVCISVCLSVCPRPYTVNFKWANLNISWRPNVLR